MQKKLSQIILVLILTMFMVPTMVSANGDTSENTGIVTPQDIPHQWVYVGEWRELMYIPTGNVKFMDNIRNK